MSEKKKLIQPNSTFNKILEPTLLLAFITALLFAVGSAYYNSYMSYWGLNADNFPQSFPEVLYSGFIVLFSLALISTSPLLIIMYGIMVVGLFAIIFFPDKFRIVKGISGKEVVQWKLIGLNLIERINSWIAITIISIFVIAIFFSGAKKVGKESASSIHEDMKIGSDPRLLNMSDRNIERDEIDKFYIIACNNFECAIFWYKAAEIELVKREKIQNSYKRIEYPEPELSSSN